MVKLLIMENSNLTKDKALHLECIDKEKCRFSDFIKLFIQSFGFCNELWQEKQLF